MSFKLVVVGKLSPVQVSRHLENYYFFLNNIKKQVYCTDNNFSRELELSLPTMSGRRNKRVDRIFCGADPVGYQFLDR